MFTDIAEATRSSLAGPARMLTALAQIGGGGVGAALIDMNLESVGLPPMVADLRRYVQGPIICHSAGGWGPEEWDSHPVHDKAYRNQILSDRINIGMGLSPWIIGPAELACVMYARTMAAPMPHHLAELYLWAGSKMIVAIKGVCPMMIETTDEDVLTGRLKHDYQQLAWEVRRKVARAQEGKDRDDRRASAHATPPKELQPIGDPDLFSYLIAAE